MSFPVIAACLLVNLTPAHSLPDNHIERGVQVYVFPERVEIHYHLGLTDRQVAAELAALAPDNAVPDEPAAALHQYERIVAPQLAEQLQLSVDGENLTLSVANIERRERHHERFVVKCNADLRIGSKPCRIEIRDMTPPGLATVECRRIALRGKHEVVLDKCSGQPTLIRVPREPVPARLYRDHEPSRTIVALCRIPAKDGGNGNEALDTSAVLRSDTAPTSRETASTSPESAAEPSAGRNLAPLAHQSTTSPGMNAPIDSDDRSRHHWPVLPLGGALLILVGLLLTALRLRRKSRPEGRTNRPNG